MIKLIANNIRNHPFKSLIFAMLSPLILSGIVKSSGFNNETIDKETNPSSTLHTDTNSTRTTYVTNYDGVNLIEETINGEIHLIIEDRNTNVIREMNTEQFEDAKEVLGEANVIQSANQVGKINPEISHQFDKYGLKPVSCRVNDTEQTVEIFFDDTYKPAGGSEWYTVAASDETKLRLVNSETPNLTMPIEYQGEEPFSDVCLK